MDAGAHWQVGRALNDGAVRRAFERAIQAQMPHFDRLGLDIGYVYGSDRPAVSEYVPRTDVGARLPHMWLDDAQTTSTHDLVTADAFTLMAPDVDTWRGAAAALPTPIRVVPIADTRPSRSFMRLARLSPSGAILVRPDGHIAWRTADSRDPRAHLEEACRRCHLRAS